ncbi:Hypothetical predicted protein, partial [Paramuricea clavata]
MKVKDQRALDKETLSTMIVHGSKDSISNVINCKDYSSLGRLLRVTAVVLKFIKLLKSRVKQEDPPTNSEVTSTDIELARVLWIKELQEEMKLNENFKSWNRDLGLFTDENGTVRCKGRLSNSSLPYSAKYPILLDTAHYLTTLIVRDCHERVMHGGIKATLTELRSKFWLVRGRNFVRKLLFNCVTCKKQDGRAYKALNSPPLPEFRVKEAPPFTYVGLDYVGPLYVKSTNDLDEKAWICLITDPLPAVFLECRPLSYVSSEDVEEPLTPAHLLSGRWILSLPDRHRENPEDEDFQVDLSTNDLNKRIPKQTVEKSSVEVGDIVLVHDENHPRSFWRIGRIKELVNSTADGKSRGAVVQVMSKKGNVTTLRRPLQLLYPMEINCKLAKEEVQLEQQEDGAQESTESERPRRRAAIEGELLIRHWIKDMNQ